MTEVWSLRSVGPWARPKSWSIWDVGVAPWIGNLQIIYVSYLVGGDWNHGIFMTFHILGIILLFDFHIFQRGRSTTNQIYICIYLYIIYI